MPNSNYDLLITQTKQELNNSWVKFHPLKTDDSVSINNQSLYLELSSDLYLDKSYRTEAEEDNSNDPFYDAKLGFNFILISPLEYRLFIDGKSNKFPSVNFSSIVNFDSYLKITTFDVELINLKTNLIDEIKHIDIIIPTPIINKKIYVIAPTSLQDYNLNINYYIDSINDTSVNLILVSFPLSKSNKISLELYQQNRLISQSTSTYYSKIIPSLDFSLTENQISKLDDIAYSINTLYNQNKAQYVSRIINGLYNKLLENNNILSESLNRDKEDTSTNLRSIKSYCLLLYLLSINLKSEATNFIYYQLIKFLKVQINNSLSIKSKNLIYGYDNQSNPYQFEDFSLLFLGYLALSISQEFSYDEETEFTLSILLERINLLYTYNYNDINKFDNQTILEGIYWASLLAYYQKNKTNILKLVILYKFYNQSFEINSLIDRLYNNLILDIFDDFEVPKPNILTYKAIDYEEIGEGLYSAKDKINMSRLKFSSLINTLENKDYKNYDYNYESFVTNAIYYKDLFEQYCIKNLPFGLSWFNDTALTAQIGVLGAVIKGLGYGALLGFIKYYSNLNKIDITKAQGKYLDAWGELVNIPRLLQETDSDYRSKLINYLQFKGNNLRELTISLQRIDPELTVELIELGQIVLVTPKTNISEVVWFVKQLNYIGARIIVNIVSTFIIQNNIERGLYAGSNNYT